MLKNRKKGFTLLELLLAGSITAMVINTLILIYTYNKRTITYGIADVQFGNQAKRFMLNFVNELHAASKITKFNKKEIEFIMFPDVKQEVEKSQNQIVEYKIKKVEGKFHFIKRVDRGNKEVVYFKASKFNDVIFTGYYYDNKKNRNIAYKYNKHHMNDINMVKVKFEMSDRVADKTIKFNFETYAYLPVIDSRISDRYWNDVDI